jgi:LPXTG-motif cell wall-anchored protein
MGATASVSSTQLAATGGTGGLAALLMGLALIVAGGAVVARRRVA